MGDGLDGGGVVTGEVEGAAVEGRADAGGHTAHHFDDTTYIILLIEARRGRIRS